MHEVIKGFNNGICWSDSWFHDIVMFEGDSVRKANVLSSIDKNGVNNIVQGRY